MKDNLIIGEFIVFIFGFFILSFLLPDQEVSVSERRHLEKLPEFSFQKVMDGDYFKSLDQYFNDQFPYRDQFRWLKAQAQFSLFQKLDNQNIFIEDNQVFSLSSAWNEKEIKHFTDKLLEIKKRYLTSNQNIYYSIIPDKIAYLESSIYPKFNYPRLNQTISQQLNSQTGAGSSFHYIDLFSLLSLDDYYRTDIHWRQEKISHIARNLVEEMGHPYVSSKMEEHTFSPFYGSLYGQSALPIEADTLTYLSNDVLDQIEVWNYEKQKKEKIYQPQALTGIDAYSVFLSGPSALLEIENPNQEEGELIIFRDSFASSLTPLLIESYHHITLIDLRYIATDLLDDLVDFEGKDILFLYSVPVINQSSILK